MRARVLINAGAGCVDDETTLERQIVDAFADAGAEAIVESIEPERIDDTITTWWEEDPKPDVIVVAGGDGTVNGAAAVAAGTDIVLSVLPLGTFNHFAKDLGIPDRLPDAARAIVDGEVQRIDVGEVNGEVFVNNSSLGAYPTMVSIRDRIRDARGWGKIRAVPVASFQVLRNPPIHRLDLEGEGLLRRRVRTPFVFIGNGRFDNADGGPIERESLDDGALSILIARTTSRFRLLTAAVRALLTGTRSVETLDRFELGEFTVSGRTRRLRVARDGEIGWMSTPLRYRCRPDELRVRAPAMDETADAVDDTAPAASEEAAASADDTAPAAAAEEAAAADDTATDAPT